MGQQFMGEDDGLLTNTATRLPVCLCLDTSGSMFDCIEELNDAVQAFYDEIKENDQAADSADVSIVTFDSTVKVAEEFSPVEEKRRPNFKANGGTDMAGGISKALEILDARKKEYKSAGRDYFQPWLVIMSDGAPNDERAIPFDDINNRVSNKVLTVFAIGIGEGADMDLLRRITKRAFQLKEHKFKEFFEWLGKSVSITSQSNKGEKISLPTEGISDFFDIDI